MFCEFICGDTGNFLLAYLQQGEGTSKGLIDYLLWITGNDRPIYLRGGATGNDPIAYWQGVLVSSSSF